MLQHDELFVGLPSKKNFPEVVLKLQIEHFSNNCMKFEDVVDRHFPYLKYFSASARALYKEELKHHFSKLHRKRILELQCNLVSMSLTDFFKDVFFQRFLREERASAF